MKRPNVINARIPWFALRHEDIPAGTPPQRAADVDEMIKRGDAFVYLGNCDDESLTSLWASITRLSTMLAFFDLAPTAMTRCSHCDQAWAAFTHMYPLDAKGVPLVPSWASITAEHLPQSSPWMYYLTAFDMIQPEEDGASTCYDGGFDFVAMYRATSSSCGDQHASRYDHEPTVCHVPLTHLPPPSYPPRIHLAPSYPPPAFLASNTSAMRA